MARAFAGVWYRPRLSCMRKVDYAFHDGRKTMGFDEGDEGVTKNHDHVSPLFPILVFAFCVVR